jgi:2-polyprenyl-6-methoxyphenol hydroxylase-like FAD-dependent oxidoreductase
VILVVGAGIAGLTAAIALQRARIEAMVYERVGNVAAGQIGAGLGLAYNATDVLRDLGLLDTALERGARTTRMEFRNAKGRPLLSWAIPEGQVQIGITRRALHEILVEALEPRTLVHDKLCTGVDQDESSVVASFEDGSTAEGSLLVGADGLRSTLRDQVHGEEEPSYAGYSVLRALVPAEEADPPLPHGVFRLFWGTGASFGMYHVGPGVIYIFGWQKSSEGEHVPPGQRKQALLDRHGDWAPEVVALIERADEDSIQQTPIYDRDPAFPWGDGRVTLAGDAAHPMTFNMGQGACQGIEDSAVLARAIARDGEEPQALRSYEEERRRTARRMTLMSRRVGGLSVLPNRVGCAARNMAMRIASVAVRVSGKRASASASR